MNHSLPTPSAEPSEQSRAPGLLDLAPSRIYFSAFFAVMLVSYGEIGRSIVSNPLVTGDLQDPIGTPLAAAKLGSALALIVGSLIFRPTKPLEQSGAGRLLPYLFLAAVSLVWTVNFETSVKGVAYLGCFLYAAHIFVRRIGAAACFRIAFRILFVAVALSAAAAVFLPTLGLHSAFDAIDGVHSGSWRGIFRHKNELGIYSGYLFVFALLYARALDIGPAVRFTAAVLASICLLNCGSITPLVVMLVGISFYWLYLSKWTASGPRIFVLKSLYLLMLIPVAAISGGYIVAASGRDLTLTGRTQIWALVAEYIVAQPWGYGFGTGPAVVFDKLTHYVSPSAVDAHNAYLDQVLDLGPLGLFCLLVAALIAVVKVVINSRSTASMPTAGLAAVVVVMAMFAGITETSPFRVNGIAGFMFFLAIVSIRSPRTGKAQNSGQ